MADTQFRYDDRDVRFILFDQLGIDRLFELSAFDELSREDVELILTEAGKMAREVIGPLDAEADRVGCQFADGKVRVPEPFHAAYRQYTESGWPALTGDPEFGGQGAPTVIGMAVAEMISGACCSFSLFIGLSRAAAGLLETYASDELKRRYVPPLNEGKWQGTMCLTEPNAGTAVGDSRTTAERDGDHYRIRGNKIFISCGEHDLTENHVHLVLARTPDAPAGTKGLSLFLVPKILPDGTPNDLVCTRIEEKMGIHASPTCAMSFGERDACVGYVVGAEQQGMEIMFHMMNEERIATGLQGLALASTAYINALEYARERIQGTELKDRKNPDAPRVPILRHPDVRRMLMTARAYVEGMRSLLLQAALYVDLAKHDDDAMARDAYANAVEILTPICKAYCSDVGFEVTRLAVQTYGGYGYLKDYPAERYMRDVKIASIYEGTNGIQALDLLGRKVARRGGMAFLEFMELIGKKIDRHANFEPVRELHSAVVQRKGQLESVTYQLGQAGQSGDIDGTLLAATPYLRMFGNLMLAVLWLEQAAIAHKALTGLFEQHGAADDAARSRLVADNDSARFHHNKIQTALFFTRQILPENDALAAAIECNDRSALDIQF